MDLQRTWPPAKKRKEPRPRCSTLVASIYGMNFENMPELKWVWGYPAALFFMILASAAPYVYFKQKGWLD